MEEISTVLVENGYFEYLEYLEYLPQIHTELVRIGNILEAGLCLAFILVILLVLFKYMYKFFDLFF